MCLKDWNYHHRLYVGLVTNYVHSLQWCKSLNQEQISALKYRMPGFPYANYIVGAFMLAVTLVMGYDHDNLVALYVVPLWYGALYLFRLFKISVAQQKADLSIRTEW